MRLSGVSTTVVFVLCMFRLCTVRSFSTRVTCRLCMSIEKPSVAVIGGGVSGLSCAAFLQHSGKFLPTVFDTGRLRPGGRCSSRLPGDRPKGDDCQKTPTLSKSIVDHAAQIITVDPNDRRPFARQVSKWEEEGIVKQYPADSIYDVVKEGESFALDPRKDKNMYHGVAGMGSIPVALVKEGHFSVEQDVRISPGGGVKFVKSKNQWKVKGHDETFDHLVIAHNGKCADRLMSRTPATALHSLLRVDFNPTVPHWGRKRMTLNSIYSLTFCIKGPSPLTKALPSSFICGFVSDDKVLRFVSCQSRKYPRDDDIEVWTILSSPKFAKRYKAPQENLPDDVADEVTDLMLESVESLFGLEGRSLRNSMIEKGLQLWGAAVPLNTYSEDGFVWDSDFSVGVCGDWLLEPSIAGAWESGRRLAEYMIAGAETSVGLPTFEEPAVFQPSKGVSKAGIGSLS